MRCLKAIVAVAILGVMLSLLAPVAAGAVLTGLIEFSTDDSGAISGNPQVWDTQRDWRFYNLYVTQANTGLGGSFLNHGDGPETSISLELIPGTYNFWMFGAPYIDVDYFALNLFFDNDNTNPAISVFAPVNRSSSPPFPAFQANNSTSTWALDLSAPNGWIVPGAGTLSTTDRHLMITLTDYRWSAWDVYNLDRVSPGNDVPDGAADFVGTFTLHVAAVPEPCALTVWWVLGASGFTVGCRRRRKRAA